MVGSAYGTSGSVGSSFGGSAQATSFVDLRLSVQSQTNALVQPSDSPATDVVRLVEDAGGNRVMWTWDQSAATWKGVQVS